MIFLKESLGALYSALKKFIELWKSRFIYCDFGELIILLSCYLFNICNLPRGISMRTLARKGTKYGGR